MRVLVCFILGLSLLVIGDDQSDGFQNELKRFQGTWTMVTGEMDGKPVADEHVKKSKITFKGATMSLHTPHQTKEIIRAEMKKLDPKTMEMHWVRSSGPGAGKTMMAIYEFISADQYRICFDPSGKTRPKAFSTQPGSGHIMHVWKRQAR